MKFSIIGLIVGLIVASSTMNVDAGIFRHRHVSVKKEITRVRGNASACNAGACNCETGKK